MKLSGKTRVRSLTLTMGLALSLAMALTMALAPVAGAQTNSDPATALAAFEKVAFGSTQDIEAALALFSDGAVLTVMPAPAGTTGVWTGKEEIRKGLQFNKQLNVARVNTGTPKVEGNKVTTGAKVTNNYFNMLGLGPVDHTTEVVVEGGKIKSYTSTMLTSEQPRVAAAAKAYQAAHPAPAQQPSGVPNTGTGAGQQASGSTDLILIPGTNFSLTTGLVGVLATGLGLVSLAGWLLTRRQTKRQPK